MGEKEGNKQKNFLSIGGKMPKRSPTQRTMDGQRKLGRVTAIAEKWNPYARRPDGGKGIRQDLFGFIDIVALDGKDIIAVQSCGDSHSAHKKKILGQRRKQSELWLQSGGKIELWSWKKKAGKGFNRDTWTSRVEEITLDMYPKIVEEVEEEIENPCERCGGDCATEQKVNNVLVLLCPECMKEM